MSTRVVTREHLLCRRQRDDLLAEFSGGLKAVEAEALRNKNKALEAEKEGLK